MSSLGTSRAPPSNIEEEEDETPGAQNGGSEIPPADETNLTPGGGGGGGATSDVKNPKYTEHFTNISAEETNPAVTGAVTDKGRQILYSFNQLKASSDEKELPKYERGNGANDF